MPFIHDAILNPGFQLTKSIPIPSNIIAKESKPLGQKI